MQKIINIAVIAHVDHGKTTLIDHMIKQGGVLRENQELSSRVMDSEDLEKERGITILAKCTAIYWKDVKINIIDTPGHSDFGAEVERVLSMADCALFLVDAAEGPMPQSKFVLTKALAAGLSPIVLINKIDRSDARANEVLDEIFDLFVSLDATDEQCDFLTLYSVARDGWCSDDIDKKHDDLSLLFDSIVENVKPPVFDANAPFSMLVTLLDKDKFLGRLLIGRINSGTAKIGESIKAINLDGKTVESGRLNKLQSFFGIARESVESAIAGDIIVVAGFSVASVADTLCDTSVTKGIEARKIDPPTMSIEIGVNDSPLAGRDGKKLTSTVIRDRLLAEAETNVAITVKENKEAATFEIGGRGELQLGVLIENMRREGFELSVGCPKVLFRKDEKGGVLEPIEEVFIDVDEPYAGIVVEKIGMKKGEMTEMKQTGQAKVRISFLVPSRGLIGYQSEFLTDTRGTGIINRVFHSYAPYKGNVTKAKKGSLISNAQGSATAYSIFNLQDRGSMFINPQDAVYEGMIIGQHTRDNDLDVNVVKGKQLTNVRASGTDKAILLTAPRIMSLEAMISYITDDDIIEVTPNIIRLRKKYLNPTDRKRKSRPE